MSKVGVSSLHQMTQTMKNAIETIRENYQSQIEEMVQKEIERFKKIEDIISNLRAMFGDVNHSDYIAYRTVALLNGREDLAYDTQMNGSKWYSAFSNSMTYGRRERLTRFVFDAFIYESRIEKTRKCHLESIRQTSIAKLESALSKYLTSEDIAKEVNTRVGSKGFEVTATLQDGRCFYTTCIGAGGYNIQEYHLRYIAKMLK